MKAYLRGGRVPLTLHLEGSQAANQPVKVGGSKPCLIRMMGVSGSLAPGCVRRNSRQVGMTSFLSVSLDSWPTQMKTWRRIRCLSDVYRLFNQTMFYSIT